MGTGVSWLREGAPSGARAGEAAARPAAAASALTHLDLLPQPQGASVPAGALHSSQCRLFRSDFDFWK